MQTKNLTHLKSDKNSKILKLKMADGRRIESHFLAIRQVVQCLLNMTFGFWSEKALSHAYECYDLNA